MRSLMDGLRRGWRATYGPVAAATFCLLAAPTGGFADTAIDSRGLSVGVLAGWTQLDPALADFQWDVTPRGAWGAELLAGTGRASGGVRMWRTQTTQALGVPGAASGPTVRATSWELVGRGRVATLWGTRVLACASAGRLHLDYSPDEMSIDPGTGTPIRVVFAPIDEWIGGGGLAFERPLGGPWTASLEIDQRMFGLEAAHRNGSAIEIGRESFGNWSARVGLAWLFAPR